MVLVRVYEKEILLQSLSRYQVGEFYITALKYSKLCVDVRILALSNACIYVTVPEKRDLVVQNKKIEFFYASGLIQPSHTLCYNTKGQNLVCTEERPAQLTLF